MTALDTTLEVLNSRLLVSEQLNPRHPTWLKIALSHVGEKEIKGAEDNPFIASLWDAIGINWGKTSHIDEIPWCAGFVGACLAWGGYLSTQSGMARSYVTYGNYTPLRPGAIIVVPRGKPPSGHVMFYLADTDRKGYAEVVHGNYGDQVCISTVRIDHRLACRWPIKDKGQLK